MCVLAEPPYCWFFVVGLHQGFSFVVCVPVLQDRVMSFGNVELNNVKETDTKNAAEMVVARGFGSVVRHRSDEERSSVYESLLELEENAKQVGQGGGVWCTGEHGWRGGWGWGVCVCVFGWVGQGTLELVAVTLWHAMAVGC